MPYEVPTWDLGDPTWMEVVADGGTPPELVQYNGRFIAVTDPAEMPPLGVRGNVRVSGVTVPGFLRNVNGSYQWMMTAQLDPLEALVEGLPGPGGWSVPASRQVWLDIGGALRGYGISGADLAYGLPALFNAARAEVQDALP